MSRRRKKSNNIIISIIIFIFLCATGYFGTDYFLEQNSVESNCLYIVSGCALTYAITNLYLHKKEKQKKFTLR